MYAQPFDTGTETAGYTLHSIVLAFQSFTGTSTLTVTVREGTAGSPSNTVLYTLVNPSTYVAGMNEFRAPSNASLDANKIYHVVVAYASNSSGPEWFRTLRSDGLDSGAADGWSIDYAYLLDGRDNPDGWIDGGSRAMKIQVKGTVNTGTTSTDATLSGLALEDASDDSELTLDPTFATGTTSYSVSVANGVDTVTVKPTVNESNATVAYLDGADAAIADADGTKDDQQVALVVGANTINVKVTAQDGTSTETYTVTVTRASDGGICGRTLAVQTAILGKISGVSACADVTTANLAAITGTLDLANKSIAALAAGDFAGLTSVTRLKLNGNTLTGLPAGVFDELTALTRLDLNGNDLASLPAGVFDQLTLLTRLDLKINKLTELDAGVFDELTLLTTLGLSGNELTGLDAGVFDKLAALTSLNLSVNELSSLRAGVFDELTLLTELDLESNQLLALPDRVFEKLTALTALRLESNPGPDNDIYTQDFLPTAMAAATPATIPTDGGEVVLDAAGSGGAWGTNVAYAWALTDPLTGVTVTYDPDAASAMTTATVPGSLTDGSTLTFTLTVTGKGGSSCFCTDTDTAEVGVADVTTNTAPVFTDGASATRAFSESIGNTGEAAARDIGNAVAATDADSDAITYSLGGTDAAKFQIATATGQIQTKADSVYSHEGAASLDVTVTANDGTDATTIAVTISVTDVDEPPLVPTITEVVNPAGNHTALDVQWSAGNNARRPAITSGTVRYRRMGTTNWSSSLFTGVNVGRIADLTSGREYEIQVRVTNAEGDGPYTASTNAHTTAPATGKPAISGTAQANRTLTASTSAIMDANGLANVSFTYQWRRLDADGSNETNISGATSSTYQLTTAEVGKKVKVRVSFTDDAGFDEARTSDAYPTSGTITAAATAATGKPTITGTAQVGETLTAGVGTIADADGLPTTFPNDYTFQWIREDDDGSNTMDISGATSSTYTLVGADEGKKIKVEVSFTDDADNPEGPLESGAYPATGTIVAETTNNPPVFSDGASATRGFSETLGNATEQSGRDIGQPVAATDSDNDALTYSLTGADAGKFSFSTSTGQIRTKTGQRYDHEAGGSYSVTVGANDGTVTVTIPVNISVTDISEPPVAPVAPSVSATSGSTTSLDVSWSTPSNTGRPAITSYDLRYREGTTGTFSDGPQNETGTSASIGSLTAETSYQVQVRATNDDGDGPWSAVGNGITGASELRFGAAAYTAVEGGSSARVTVQLTPGRASAVTIPLIRTNQGGATAADYSGIPASLTFAANETERTFTVTATDDSEDDDGESVRIGFGTLPAGVASSAPATAEVALRDNDNDGTKTWSVFFYESSYTATEGGAGARVSVRLSEPWKPWLNQALRVPLYTPELQGGASESDYSGWPSSVTFQPGRTAVTFTITATDDSDDDDGESILLQFGTEFPEDLQVDRHGQTTVHLKDDDGSSAVRVSFGAENYTAVEGGATATVQVRLNAAPGRSVTVPLTRENLGASNSDYSGVPQDVTFGSNETQKTFTVTATDDSLDDDHESVKLGFGTLPAAVTAGSPGNATMALEDNDGVEEMYEVSFDADKTMVRPLREGGSSFWTGVRLDRRAETELTIPLVVTHTGGATAADYTGLPATVTIKRGKRDSGFKVKAVDDREDDPGEGLVVKFGTMAGVTVNARLSSATFNIVDNDGLPLLSVADASVRESRNPKAYLQFKVTLDRSVTHVVRVDYTTVDGTAVAGEDYVAESGTLVLDPGETSKTVWVGVEYDDVAENTESMKLVLSNAVGAVLADGEAEGRILNEAAASSPAAADPEDADRALVEDVTPEAAAAALLGEDPLSSAQLEALDRLGNRNGSYDLGDVLSWAERCRSTEAGCGQTGSAPSPSREPLSGAALLLLGALGRRARRRLALVAVTLLAWGCGDGGGPLGPAMQVAVPDPGFLKVELTSETAVRATGVLLAVEGAGIEGLRSASGFELFQSEGSSRREIIVAGDLSSGPIVEFWVPDRTADAQYRVRLLQVTGEDYRQEDVSAFTLAISR